jgi:hypothetical protein
MVHMNRKRNLSDSEWLQLASESIPDNENRGQLLIATGVIGGLIVAGATSFPPTGVLFAGWCLYNAFRGNADADKNQESIEKYGYVAHCLKGNDLRDFREQFGDDEAFRQIEWAKDRGFWVSGDAEDFADTFNIIPTLQKGNAFAAKPELQTVASSLGTSTYQQLASTVEVYDRYADSKINIIPEMTERITNLFIVGLGGSGKGMLLANALREVKRSHPTKKIFLVNGKDDPKERGYFDGIVDIHKALHCESAKPQTVAAWFESCIDEYDQFAVINNGALLVIDEGTIIGARLKTAKCTLLADKLIGITSCGGSSGKNIWFVAQTPYVGANGSDLSGISQLTPIAIVSKNNLAVLDTWKSARLFKKFDSDEIAELVQQSECDRAVYFGKTAEWYSMPELTNYSGYNRDKREYLPGHEPKDDSICSDLKAINQLEGILDNSEKQTEIRDISEETETEISDTAMFVLNSIVKESKKDYISFESIRKSRRWGDRAIDFDALRQIIKQLIQHGKIEGDDSVGYRAI